MGAAAITLGTTRAVSAKVVFLYRGAWFAEVDLDPDSDPVTSADMPSGKVVLTITPAGKPPIVLNGTVDPQDGGRFVSAVKVHMLAGGGGWAKPVAAQHFNQPAGLSALTVESATASLVGEVVNDPAPISLGTDWSREGPPNPASSIFADRQWYVDPTGITQVQPWPPATPDASVEILSWDPIQQRGELSADALILPGTVLTDARFDGPITVRDVEMTFTKEGVRATVWCSSAAMTRLVSALTMMVRVLGQLAPLKIYRYRVVLASGATWTLQPVPLPDGTPSPEPPLANVKVWPGMFGLSCTPPLSAHVGVMFLDGNRGAPVVVSFDGTLPPSVTLDAQGVVNVGPTAPATKIGATPLPLATGIGTAAAVAAIAVWIAAFQTEALLVSPALGFAMVTPSSTVAAAMVTATTAIPTKTVTAGP